MKQGKYTYRYPHPAVATDCVIFGFDGKQLQALLIERGLEPFIGKWAFPGGFLRIDETAEDGALRELSEETGLQATYIEQFGCYTALDRDPRERVISIAFMAIVKIAPVLGGDDAARAQWWPVDGVPELAFDHAQILNDALQRLRERIYFRPIGFDLLPEQFSLTQLQTLYEAVLGLTFDRRNFAKKINHLGLVTAVAEQGRKRPQLYQFNLERYNELKTKGYKLEF